MSKAICARSPCGCLKAIDLVEMDDRCFCGAETKEQAFDWLMRGLAVTLETERSWTLPQECDECKEST